MKNARLNRSIKGLNELRDSGAWAQALLGGMAQLFYFVGLQTEYALLLTMRRLRQLIVCAGQGFVLFFQMAAGVLRPFFHTVGRDLAAPWQQMAQEARNLRAMLREERRRGETGLARKGWRYVLRGVYVYRGLFARGLAYLMPVGAACLFALTVGGVFQYQFALRVEYRGQTVGFVAHDTVYDEAKQIIDQRLQGGHDVAKWEDYPSFSLSMVSLSEISDRVELADHIIALSSDQFQEAAGVFVNGVLIGASANRQAVQEAYEAPLRALNPTQSPDVHASYRQQVEVQQGLYFTDTLIDSSELIARLTGQAPMPLPGGESTVWNVLAETQKTVRVSYTEEYEAPEERIERPDLEWGTENVLREGVPGVRHVTADVVYINDMAVQQTVIEQIVEREPIARQIEVGTHSEYGVAGAPGDGSFIWPVPDYKDQSRGFITYGSYVYHRGLDITGPYGTPIYAADSGVVTFAGRDRGYNWSYGNFVEIDHGNGYTTLYGHMAAVAVSQGAYVEKGQLIGYVGSTGRSTGNHCHFELTKDGVLQDPARYVQRPPSHFAG